MVDQGTQLEQAVKDLFTTLDKQYTQNFPLYQYKASLLPQLKPVSPVILNGNPIGGKASFQEVWMKFPSTQHSITSVDYHIIVGTGTVIVNISGKVRFDESGKTRLGETADLQIQGLPTGPSATTGNSARAFWGSWVGFNANLIVDETIFQGINNELINSLNWKVIYTPDDSAIKI